MTVRRAVDRVSGMDDTKPTPHLMVTIEITSGRVEAERGDLGRYYIGRPMLTSQQLESALADARAALDRVEARLRAEVRA